MSGAREAEEEFQRDLGAVSEGLRIYLAMLKDTVQSLRLLHEAGTWEKDPAEMRTAGQRGVLEGITSNLKKCWVEELALWPTGAEALLRAIYEEGGPDLDLGTIVKAAKRRPATKPGGRSEPWLNREGGVSALNAAERTKYARKLKRQREWYAANRSKAARERQAREAAAATVNQD